MQNSESFREEVIDIGNTVLCDLCNGDYTESDEQGGVLFGSYALCPKCAPQRVEAAKESGNEDEISAQCPEGMSFREWVLQLRGGDNTIRIQSWE
jgi:hypothetical protein